MKSAKYWVGMELLYFNLLGMTKLALAMTSEPALSSSLNAVEYSIYIPWCSISLVGPWPVQVSKHGVRPTPEQVYMLHTRQSISYTTTLHTIIIMLPECQILDPSASTPSCPSLPRRQSDDVRGARPRTEAVATNAQDLNSVRNEGQETVRRAKFYQSISFGRKLSLRVVLLVGW